MLRTMCLQPESLIIEIDARDNACVLELVRQLVGIDTLPVLLIGERPLLGDSLVQDELGRDQGGSGVRHRNGHTERGHGGDCMAEFHAMVASGELLEKC